MKNTINPFNELILQSLKMQATKEKHFMSFGFNVIVIVLLTACLSPSQRHPDFSALAECDVRNDEVITEKYLFGEVDRIDMNKASGCAKANFSNTYLLYMDSNCMAVYNTHPKNTISEIKYFTNKYQNDSCYISDFVVLDSSIVISISRRCMDVNSDYFGDYIDWKTIKFNTHNKPMLQLSEELMTLYYNWKN